MRTMLKQNWNKVLTLFLALALLLSLSVGLAAPASAASYTMSFVSANSINLAGGDDVSISSATEWNQLAAYVNTSTNNTVGVLFYLANDIYLNPQAVAEDYVDPDVAGTAGYTGPGTVTEFVPVGGGAASTSFKGTFNGNDYTIYNAFYNQSAGSWSGGNTVRNNIGLFGKVDVGGTVENLTVRDGYVGAQRSVGGIVGKNWGTVDNCHNDRTFVYSNNTQGVGGIVGANWINSVNDPAPTVKNCTNDGKIVSTFTGNADPEYFSQGGSSGGIVGENEGYVYDCYNGGKILSMWNAGGIVGSNQNNAQQPDVPTLTLGDVRYNENTGHVGNGSYGYYDVNSNYVPVEFYTTFAGGIAGWNYAIVRWNTSYGEVRATSPDYGTGGGIVGENDNWVYNCINNSPVYATEYAGGIVGENNSEGRVANCYNSVESDIEDADVSGGIIGYQAGLCQNVYNMGSVSGDLYAGQIIGELDSALANNNLWYYLPFAVSAVGVTTSGNAYASSFTPANQIDLRDGLNAWVLANGGYGFPYAQWSIITGVNNGYPTF